MTRPTLLPGLLAAALATGALALAAPTASADPPAARAEGHRRGPDPARIRQRLERLAERAVQELQLDEGRAAKVRRIARRTAERMARILRETPRGPERRLAMMRARHDAFDGIYELLSCEEKDRFRALERRWREEHARRRMARRMGRHGRDGHGHGHGPRGHRGEGGRRGPGRAGGR